MASLKIILFLCTLPVLLELVSRLTTGQRLLPFLRGLLSGPEDVARKRAEELAAAEDEMRHRHWWGYLDEEHQDDQRTRFHKIMRNRMMEVKTCHKDCKWEASCQKKCPQPWKTYQGKCIHLLPIWKCHQECWRTHDDHTCFEACPSPEEPQLAKRVKTSIKCHEECPRVDPKCHHKCPHPMAFFGERCDILEDSLTCHQKCNQNETMVDMEHCHTLCTKMRSIWPIHGAPHIEPLALADESRHKSWWGEDPGLDRLRFHDHMRNKTMAMRVCHMECGRDNVCHDKCPEPWRIFYNNCTSVHKVWMCHRDCGLRHGGYACHSKCDLPDCPKLASEVKADLECHRNCGHHHHACHLTCPHPLAAIGERCDELQKVVECHSMCPLDDLTCHHVCPKLWSQWHLDGFKGDERNTPTYDEEVLLEHWWDYRDEEHQEEHRKNFHKTMRDKMNKARFCHRDCQQLISAGVNEDAWNRNAEECHSKCQSPWSNFREKCNELEPVWECHRDCRDRNWGKPCHSQCPWPDDPKLGKRFKDALVCHDKCGKQKWDSAGNSCHHACPHPLLFIGSKCAVMKQATSCHAKCGTLDHGCHHSCPRMSGAWHVGDIEEQFVHV